MQEWSEKGQRVLWPCLNMFLLGKGSEATEPYNKYAKYFSSKWNFFWALWKLLFFFGQVDILPNGTTPQNCLQYSFEFNCDSLMSLLLSTHSGQENQ